MNETELEQLSELYRKAKELIENRINDYCMTITEHKKADSSYNNFIGCDSYNLSFDYGITCDFRYTEGARGYYNTYSDSILLS